MTTTSTKSVRGEDLEVSERVILAPAVGVFQPVAGEAEAVAVDGREEKSVTEGEVVGVVEARGQAVPVRSAFSGFLMGMLAHPGERVREGQPVAWLRVL
jgi:biotin carboxyl carrier protein